ncbi:unnamed protein product, partial [Closterium sp. NIES-54]
SSTSAHADRDPPIYADVLPANLGIASFNLVAVDSRHSWVEIPPHHFPVNFDDVFNFYGAATQSSSSAPAQPSSRVAAKPCSSVAAKPCSSVAAKLRVVRGGKILLQGITTRLTLTISAIWGPSDFEVTEVPIGDLRAALRARHQGISSMAFTASTMANPITPLRLEADGSSSNFKAWSYGVDKHLLSRDVQGLDLKDVLLNHGKGKQPLLPREPTESASEADIRAYEEAVEKYRKWEKADAAIISVFIASTPSELVNTFHNYPTSNAIWKYLQDRFMNKTAVGVAILIPSMFQVRLEDCSGMADYIAKVQTIHGELKELGIVFPEQAPVAALLVGLTTAYEITRKMLLTLTAEVLTFAKVSTALLSAEKDSTAQAKAYAICALMPQASVAAALASAPLQRNRFPPCTYVVKYGNRKGQVCGGTNHPLATCFKKKDDEWYAVHGIDKRPPNWMRARKANLVEVQDPASASASDIAPADVRINLLFPGTAMINEASSQYLGASQAPQYIEFTLDSGATHTVLKETLSFKPYATPIPLLGADSSFTTLAKGSSTVPKLGYAPSSGRTRTMVISSTHSPTRS